MFSIHVAVEWKPNTIRKHSYANLISRNTNKNITQIHLHTNQPIFNHFKKKTKAYKI